MLMPSMCQVKRQTRCATRRVQDVCETCVRRAVRRAVKRLTSGQQAAGLPQKYIDHQIAHP